jgi:hypothetical protein
VLWYRFIQKKCLVFLCELFTGNNKEFNSMSDPGETIDIKGPLVFSCIKCKTIVGDSYSLFHTNEEFKTITLSASSNIQRTNELYTSNQEHDNGSSYFCFICLSCHQPLGRYYVTTNTNLDTIREKFTFDIDSISSYEVGKAQHGKSVEPEVAKPSDDVTTTTETAEISEEVLKVYDLFFSSCFIFKLYLFIDTACGG